MSVQRLEPRSLLSSADVTTVADAGGLPRQLTAIGDYVFYVLDPRADGKRSASDVVSYNVKTGLRQSVRRPDGSRFSHGDALPWQTGIALEKNGNRLRITERPGDTGIFWSLKPGSKTARPTDPPLSAPSAIPAEHVWNFAIDGQSWTNRTVYIASKTVFAYDAARNRLGVVPVPYEKHLLHIKSVTPAGDRLFVNAEHRNGSKLYVIDRKTLAGQRFRPTSDATDVSVTSAIDDRTIFLRAQSAGVWSYFLSDGTDVGSRRVTTGDVSEQAYRFFRGGDQTFYGFQTTNLVQDAWDPESDPSPPGGGTYRPGLETGIVRLDLSPGATPRLTHVALPSGSGHIADDVTAVDGAIYFRAGTTGGTRSDPDYAPQVMRLDLATGHVGPIGRSVDRLVVAGGRPVFVNGVADRTLSTGVVRGGRVDVGVFIDDARAKSLNGRRLITFEAYVDANRNGKQDAGEGGWSNYGRPYFDFPKAGTYHIGIVPQKHFEATRGWTRTVTVRDGKATTIGFGVIDTLKQATIGGLFPTKLGIGSGGTPGRAVWLDLDEDGVMDPAEPQTTIKAFYPYDFQFRGLSVGEYLVRQAGDPNRYRGVIRTPGQVSTSIDFWPYD